MYGGEAVLYSPPTTATRLMGGTGKYLEKDHDFKYAALVHCDTPSGMLNDVSKALPAVKKVRDPDPGGLRFGHVRRGDAGGRLSDRFFSAEDPRKRFPHLQD